MFFNSDLAQQTLDSLVDDDQSGLVEVDVLSQIIATQKADFFIRRQGGITRDDVLRDYLSITVEDSIATSRLSSPNLTWFNTHKTIPNMTEGCATVYGKLGTDFRASDGGKHPGFSNTGISFPGSDVVSGVTYPDTGWGGRRPDGIHWSARTGYGK